MGAISKVLQISLEKEMELPIIESLSDATRLITDAMHDETAIRRSLIISNVNPEIRKMLNSTTANEYLFGRAVR